MLGYWIEIRTGETVEYNDNATQVALLLADEAVMSGKHRLELLRGVCCSV